MAQSSNRQYPSGISEIGDMLRFQKLLVLCVLLLPVIARAQDGENSVLTRLHPRPQVSWLRESGSFIITPQTRILVSDSASRATWKAVAYLQKLIKEQVGDTLRVLPESMSDKMQSIYVGTTSDFSTLLHIAATRMVTGESLDRAESYLLDVQGLTTVMLGSDSNGIFDAVSTFAQFFIGPSLHTSIPGLHILDWPDYSVRWVFSQHNLQVASQIDALAEIEDTMAFHKLSGLQQNDFKYNRLESVPSWYFTNVDSLHRHSDRTNVEIIPGVAPIGYSEGILLHDPDLAEGFETNTRFVIAGDSGRLIGDPNVTLANGGFEAYTGNTFTGYGFQDAPGDRTFVDNTVHHSGSASMKCTNMTGGNTRVIKTLPCKPNQGYHLSVWAKTSGFSGYFQILAIGINNKGVSQTLTFTQYSVPSTGDWKQYNVIFNTLGNTQVSLYAGIWGDAQGTIWLDDFAVEDAGLANIVRRPTTKPTVSVLHKSGTYAEGRDYTGLIDTVMEQSAGSYTWHAGPSIHIPNGSSIQPGDTVNLYFWRANPVLNYENGDGSTMVCVSEDTLYSILHDQISRVEQLHHPNQYMMGHDEIRALNQDSACLSRNLTAAQLLADNLTKCDSIVHVVHPSAPTYVWSDMFDSLHNAHANYYLVNGDLYGDWDLIPKDISIVNWSPDKKGSLEFFARKGFRQVTSPYYDVPDTRNIREWRIAMEGVPNVDGMMYTTWSGDYSFLTPFADYAWSAGPMIVHQPYDTAQVSYGDSVAIDASVYPDPYDPTDRIDPVILQYQYSTARHAVLTKTRMVNDSAARWRSTIPIVTDPGTDISYTIIAKNKQGITRTTPEYLLYRRQPIQGVTITEAQGIALSPNPAKDVLKLELPDAGNRGAVQIVNASGRSIKQVIVQAGMNTIDIHDLPSGGYMVHFVDQAFRDRSFVIVR
jgi:hypothetical protein